MQSPSLFRFTRQFRFNVLEARVVCDVAPTAVDDTMGFDWAQAANALDVLANDYVNTTGATLDPSTVTVVTPPQFGALTLDPTSGELLYTPNYLLPPGLPPGRVPPPPPEQEQFKYTVKDSLGMESNVAAVTMRQGGGGGGGGVDAEPDFGVTQALSSVTIDLLGNDVIWDGSTFVNSTLRLTPQSPTNPSGGAPRHGSVTMDPNTGSAKYTPNAGYIGWDRFTYTIDTTSGLVGTSYVTLIINSQGPRLLPDPNGGQYLLVEGTNQADTITIRPDHRWNDVIVNVNGVFSQSFGPISRIVVYGYSGDDTITVSRRLRMPAWLIGGFGNDRLQAGSSSSLLMGSEGNDTLLGDWDRDVLIGGTGEDVLKGSFSADLLVGGQTTFDDQPAELARVFASWTRNSSWRPAWCRWHRSQSRDIVTNTDVIDDGDKDTLDGGPDRDLILGANGTPLDDVVHPHDSWRRSRL
jgi:Ca2+-binding RTX toxin-like protein